MPVIKNGPKGISDLRVFLPENISPNPIIAPRKKAKNRATRILGNPKISPIKKASFISPIPIHFPRETKTISKKKTEAKIADKREFIKVFKIQIPKSKFQNKFKIQNSK